MRRALKLAVLLTAAGLLPAPAAAQAGSGVRLIVNLAGGPGSARFQCATCLTQKEQGSVGNIRIGRPIRSDLVVGLDVNGWAKKQDAVTISVGAADLFAQYFPGFPRFGFYVLGGFGGGTIREDQQVVEQGQKFTVTADGSGLGYHAGAGYLFQIAPHVAANAWATYFGTSRVELLGDPFNARIFALGLGLTLN